MSSIESFNEMMKQFIDELVMTFPDVKKFKTYQKSFILISGTKSKQAVTEYYESIKEYSDKIMKKDETFFTEDAPNIEFVNDLKIQDIWTDELSSKTKNAIWQYLQTLFILASTIKAIPQETLTVIENIAKSFNPADLGSLLESLGKNPL